jgi:branched-chain amino acid transport system permease protein
MASTGGLENEVRSSGLSAKRRRQLILYGFGALLLLLLVLRLSVVLSRENYTITYWSFQIINGLVLGGVYALVALGYTMVYGILFMINFAHGEVMMMGGFAGYFTLQVVTQLGWVDGTAAQSLAALIIILLAGMITSVLVGSCWNGWPTDPYATRPAWFP